MPLTQIKGISGRLTQPQKEELIGKVTDAIVTVEGEALRPNTWVLLEGSFWRLGRRWIGPHHG
jgi:4-oxalocrotonate tautomerase